MKLSKAERVKILCANIADMVLLAEAENNPPLVSEVCVKQALEGYKALGEELMVKPNTDDCEYRLGRFDCLNEWGRSRTAKENESK